MKYASVCGIRDQRYLQLLDKHLATSLSMLSPSRPRNGSPGSITMHLQFYKVDCRLSIWKTSINYPEFMSSQSNELLTALIYPTCANWLSILWRHLKSFTTMVTCDNSMR